MTSKLPSCVLHRGFLSIRRPLLGMMALCFLSMLVSKAEAKPGSFRTAPNKLTLADTAAHAKLTVAASQAHGEVSDAPPAYIDGVFINLPKQDKAAPIWLTLWNSTMKAGTSALPKPSTCVVSRGNLHESLVRMAALYASIEAE